MTTAMSPNRFPSHQAGLLLMLAGAAIDSTSGLFTRLIAADGFTLASGRGLFGVVVAVGMLLWRDGWKAPASLRAIGLWGLLVVALNATGMVMNVLSLHYTSVANFYMIFATAPFAAAIAARFVLDEKLDVATMLAAVAGFAGIAVMMASGARSGGLLGDLLAIGCIITFSGIILIVRRTPGFDILAVASLTILTSGLITWPFANFSGLQANDWLLLALFGMVQLAIGNVLIYMAMARIPAAQSGLLGILNAGFAPLWVLAFLGEVPSTAALIGGSIIVSAAVAHFLWTMLAVRKLAVAET